MTLRKLIVAIVAVGLLTGMNVSTALAQLDTPSISLGATGFAKQQLTITAGASGFPNGFTVWWMDQDAWLSAGGQWPTDVGPGLGYASFTGTPTLNTFGGQYTTFVLGSNQSIMVEIGDLADESGVAGTLGELDYGTTYYFCAFANDGVGGQGSALSSTMASQTETADDCTFTIGYWKNHKEAWPVNALQLGSVIYTKQELCDILDQPVEGNGLVSLAHQLIGTKLNLANGASPTDILSAVDDADVLINGLVVPPVGAGYLDPSVTSMLTQQLDDFNNGLIGPGHCGTVPAFEKSWGEIKSLYE